MQEYVPYIILGLILFICVFFFAQAMSLVNTGRKTPKNA